MNNPSPSSGCSFFHITAISKSMIMALMSVLTMMAACLARVFQLTFEISLNYIHDRTAATSHYFNSARRQFVEGTHTHIAGKHKCHAVFL